MPYVAFIIEALKVAPQLYNVAQQAVNSIKHTLSARDLTDVEEALADAIAARKDMKARLDAAAEAHKND